MKKVYEDTLKRLYEEFNVDDTCYITENLSGMHDVYDITDENDNRIVIEFDIYPDGLYDYYITDCRDFE